VGTVPKEGELVRELSLGGVFMMMNLILFDNKSDMTVLKQILSPLFIRLAVGNVGIVMLKHSQSCHSKSFKKHQGNP